MFHFSFFGRLYYKSISSLRSFEVVLGTEIWVRIEKGFINCVEDGIMKNTIAVLKLVSYES